MYAALGQRYGWASPEVISRMPLPQLFILLDGVEGTPDNPAAVTFASHAELIAYLDQRRAENTTDEAG